MILTYKIKHGGDYTDELRKAKKVAKYAIANRNQLSTKHVSHIGLKSIISNQILRKYGRNKKAKAVKRVNLIIPNQGIREEGNNIMIPSLKLGLDNTIPVNYEKINQIEINDTYAFVSVTATEKPPIDSDNYIGVDLNATGHVAVVADPQSGKTAKLGKKAGHTHAKYKSIRKTLQKKGKTKRLRKVKRRESNIVCDLNHKISRKIVDMAVNSNSHIKLEQLKGIRKTAKTVKNFRYSLNSWSFYQLGEFIKYKAKLQGIEVVYIDPRNTSKSCSRCGLIGNRDGKTFKCPGCGHVDHADTNAAFNIGKRSHGIDQSIADRDVIEGSTDAPKGAMPRKPATPEPHVL